MGSRRMPRRRRLLAVLTLLVTVGCTAGPSDRPPVAVRDADVAPQPPPLTMPTAPELPPPGEYSPRSLPWQDCTQTSRAQLEEASPTQADSPSRATLPSRVDCAELRVEANRATPTFQDSLVLDLTRVGTGPAPLVVLGEAGDEPGTLRAVRLAGQLPASMLESYTLIGLARRGTGPSDPLNCVLPLTRQRIIGVDPTGAPAQLDLLLHMASTAVQNCVQQTGELLTVVDSTSTADDLETLRVRLGAPVLNVLSHGEASRAVTDFIRRYPMSVGRVVLDGAHDPTLDGITGAEAAMVAADTGFDAFAADCVDRDCALGSDPRAALAELTEQLRTAPLTVGQQQITPGTVYQAVLEALGTPQRWPELSAALADARDGDGTGVAELVEPLLAPTEGLPARFDPALATHCNDTRTRVPPERVAHLVEQWRQRSALFGPLFAQRLLLCSSWPVPTAPESGSGNWGLPPVLILSTAGDPVTPADGARRTAELFPSGILVTWQGTAHGAVPHSGCATAVVNRFLVDDEIPLHGTLCPP